MTPAMRRQAAALGLLGTGLLWASAGGCRRAGSTGNPTGAARPGGGTVEPAMTVDLYFPGAGGFLYVEHREIPGSAEARDRIRAVVGELLAGPRGDALAPPLPAGVRLAGVDLIAGVAYIDLRSGNPSPPPSSGSRREILTVYSLADSVVLNVPEAQRVVLLWNGVQPESFGGHLDTAHPLAANTELIAGRTAR